MTSLQKTLVQSTFVYVTPMAEQASALFYGRLFELDPSLRPLFKTDIKEQGRKLMQMLGYCVGKLDTLEEILPAVRALGVKHVGYGVKPESYDTVGTALLWALEKGLGHRFTPEVKAAWAAVYGILAAAMISGAPAAHPQAAALQGSSAR